MGECLSLASVGDTREDSADLGLGGSAGLFGICDGVKRILVRVHTHLLVFSFYFPDISRLPNSIIKRAGVVPMSIAGIFKEVMTITVSAWVFGDELTPLNILGVGITFVGASYILPQSTKGHQ